MTTRLAVVLASATLLSCSSRPSRLDRAPKVSPDEQYEVGSTWADRFLIWKCHEGERVAMIQACAPHSCADWRVYRGACGTPTAGEISARTTVAKLDGGSGDEYERHPIPDGSGWR